MSNAARLITELNTETLDHLAGGPHGYSSIYYDDPVHRRRLAEAKLIMRSPFAMRGEHRYKRTALGHDVVAAWQNSNREKRKCAARQYSDQMQCAKCGITWDTNDIDPPKCGNAA